ncbi:MAG: M10 family metallopeptidase C-terminal domain-containing protein, partial [Planctomycetaceae bacterium]
TGYWNGLGKLTLSGNGTVAEYEAALRSVKYLSSSQNPAARIVGFQVSDGSEVSNLITRSIGGMTQLVGSTLNVYGTSTADIISIAETTSLAAVVNGATFLYNPASVSVIKVFGFSGDDTISVSSLKAGTDLIADAGAGNDKLTVLQTVLVGTTLLGGDGNDTLTGGRGNDSLQGGSGNDNYVFGVASTPEADSLAEATNGGTDTLTFSSLTTAVHLNLVSNVVQNVHFNRTLKLNSHSTFENATGGSGDDILTGNGLGNILTGNLGNDILVGNAGNDQLLGGLGDDNYVFGVAGTQEADSVTEATNGGTDTLTFSALTTALNLSLVSNVVQNVHVNRTLKLNSHSTFENATGGSGDDVLTGNGLANTLVGNAGNDILVGSVGNDQLLGGLGDDNYVFGVAGTSEADSVTEATNGGTDTLTFSSLTTAVNLNLVSNLVQNVHINRTLKLNSHSTFENAIGGSGDDILLGNGLANTLVGNAGNDILAGSVGNDQLLGGAGRDILIGGSGLDLIDGGSGDDILIAGLMTNNASTTSLRILQDEWLRATPYEIRVSHLRSGVGSPLTSLQARVNVFSDVHEVDLLTGGTGRDWYFKIIDDLITDIMSSEFVDVL